MSYSILPDYSGNSIVNLMQSLIEGCGGQPSYPGAVALPPPEVAAAGNVVFSVIDGLGFDWLVAQSGGSCLKHHLRGCLTSVYPSTTATAITSFMTGMAPCRHGMVGWYTYLSEVDDVVAVLPGRRRGGEILETYDPCAMTGLRPVYDRLPIRSYVIAPQRIARSRFNQAHLGCAKSLTYRTLPEMFDLAARVLRLARERTFLYLYWPDLDAVGHEFGIESDEAAKQLHAIDLAFESWLDAIKGSDALVVVTADHGQFDTRESDRLVLEAHPELASCLSRPLCGEPRAVYCHLHPHSHDRFMTYLEHHLGEYLTCHPTAELVRDGWFGLGVSHPSLLQRIGDYVLVMKDRYVLKDWLPGERRYTQIGVHGGTSAAEMRVPLLVARA
ncbi:MAG: alkaline phosphatase family protein [Thiotrichales bacterium]